MAIMIPINTITMLMAISPTAASIVTTAVTASSSGTFVDMPS